MAGGYLFGWDDSDPLDKKWVKVKCNAAGEILMSPVNFVEKAREACKLNGELFWSCAGGHFGGLNPNTDDVRKASTGILIVQADGIYLIANVNLPHGATVNKVIVYGNTAIPAETWTLARIKISDATTNTLGSSPINTEDSSISYETVDNSLYSYYFYTSSLNTDDQIWGARITYTL